MNRMFLALVLALAASPDTVLVAPIPITGSTAYYYDPDTFSDYYKGVFVEGRTVTLSPFYIAKYETTYELWHEVYRWATDEERGGDVYSFANPGREGDDGTDGAAPTEAGKTEPVTCISWRDAVVWCNAYSEMSGKEPVYRNGSDVVLRNSTDTPAVDGAVMKAAAKGCCLPTEAEWEYAARGGGSSAGEAFAYRWAGTDVNLWEYAWYYDNSYNKGSGDPDYGTHRVGEKTGNGLGLFDMSGNVFEWCWDWYDTGSTETETDPTGPASGADRVFRGGSWGSAASGCAVANRDGATPGSRFNYLGFRLAACP
jgi:formylglycine-generating enzyme required for sulfatase activity